MELNQMNHATTPKSLSAIPPGESITNWARNKGFSVRLVYSILRGERKCLRGQSYRIAQELGMKR